MQIGGLHEIEGNSPMRHERQAPLPRIPVSFGKKGDLAMRHKMEGTGRAKLKTWTRFELPTEAELCKDWSNESILIKLNTESFV